MPLRERAGVRGAGHDQLPCLRGQAEYILRRGLNEPFPLSRDSGIRESNSAWIPQAEVAQSRRAGISPRAVRRLVDCGYLTVRLISGCQARVLADDVDCLLAQHTRPATARDRGNIPSVEHIGQSHHATAKLPAELVRLSTTLVNRRGPPSLPRSDLGPIGPTSWGRACREM
jgi:hypothetical protein